MADNTNNQLNINDLLSSQNRNNANNTNASGSQYKVVMSEKDPTKLKLKLIQTLSTILPPSTDPSLNHASTVGNANQIANGLPSAMPPSTTTTTLLLNKQIPVTSYTSHFANNTTAGSTPNSTYTWHIPTPYPHPYNPGSYAGPSSSSSSSLSSSSSSPASARTSPPGLQQKAYDYSSSNWQIINQGQSSSTTMPSQIPSAILNNNTGGTGSYSSFYSTYNVPSVPPISIASSSSSSKYSSPMYTQQELISNYQALSNRAKNVMSQQTNNSLPSAQSQSSYGSHLYNNSQQNGIIPTIPSATPPAIATVLNSTMIPTTNPIPMAPPMAAPININQLISNHRAVFKRKETTLDKMIVKQSRGRPKKTSRIKSADFLSWIQSSAARQSNTMQFQTSSSSSIPKLPPTSTQVLSTNPTITQFVRPPVTAIPPMPPNWLESCEDTIMSLYSLKKYKINPSTMEYQTITKMVHPVVVKGIDKVVNPDLWKRFVNTRKEMLRSKTDDLNILPKLGLDELEVLRCAHLTLNYNKDPLLLPYSDNMVLLFHCTRNQTNLNSILSQGLDERLSSISGGLLGKGIYFADDPQKSIQYDGTGSLLIFAVLLGDCISVDHFPNKNGLVREPEKVTQQKRNFNDHFFDSIVARPAGHNEYVIYNRYQCCPLYQIEYERSVRGNQLQNNFNYATQSLPPIAWIPEGPNYAMPVQKVSIHWPFYAVDLFKEMGVTPPTDEDNTDSDMNSSLTGTNTPQMSIDEKLATLLTLGFCDVEKNKEILSKFNNDLDQAVNYFLDHESDVVAESNQPSTSGDIKILSPIKNVSTFTSTIDSPTSTTSSLQSKSIPSTSGISKRTTSKKAFVTINLIDDDSGCSDDDMMDTNAVQDLKSCKVEVNTPDTSAHSLPDDLAEWALEFDPNYLSAEPELKHSAPDMDECLICYNEYESFETSASLWKELQCSHKLCLACYSNILTTRTTMQGVQHTFVKCPFCQGTTGIEVGTCPDLQMNVSIINNSCESYEPTNSISINYSGVAQSFNRTAYLPNNGDGQEILSLLRIAHDRRLCFTVGTSVTTGRDNAIVWNIHHKTSLRGGVSSYGYPDATYMDRVKWELKAFGIE